MVTPKDGIFSMIEEVSVLEFSSDRVDYTFDLPIITELQLKIIELRKEGLTYKAIQLKLGNPSKKFIRETLLEHAPKLVGDVVENYNKLK